jgi:hypothetical protein
MTTPIPSIDKAESRSIRLQIRKILLEIWDPIGIKDEPKAQDEYDSYIGGLYELLVRRAAGSELVEYLYWAAHDQMGFDAAERSDMLITAE